VKKIQRAVDLTEEELSALLEHAFDRYFGNSGPDYVGGYCIGGGVAYVRVRLSAELKEETGRRRSAGPNCLPARA